MIIFNYLSQSVLVVVMVVVVLGFFCRGYDVCGGGVCCCGHGTFVDGGGGRSGCERSRGC